MPNSLLRWFPILSLKLMTKSKSALSEAFLKLNFYGPDHPPDIVVVVVVVGEVVVGGLIAVVGGFTGGST